MIGIGIGKRYPTRGGQYAVVDKIIEEEGAFPLSGRCLDRDHKFVRIAFWAMQGRYLATQPSQFDINTKARPPSC